MANLPPQLDRTLGDAAPSVAEFSELGPGIPWTPQLLGDLYEQLRNRGTYEVTITTMPGYAKVVAAICCEHRRKQKETAMVGFLASVACYGGSRHAATLRA